MWWVLALTQKMGFLYISSPLQGTVQKNWLSLAKPSQSHTSWQRTRISKNRNLTPFAEKGPLCVSPSGNSHMSQVAWMSYATDRTLMYVSYIIHQRGCQTQAEGFSECCTDTWAHSPCWNRYRTLTSNQQWSTWVHFANADGFWDRCTASWHPSHRAIILLANALAKGPAKWGEKGNANPIAVSHHSMLGGTSCRRYQALRYPLLRQLHQHPLSEGSTLFPFFPSMSSELSLTDGGSLSCC